MIRTAEDPTCTAMRWATIIPLIGGSAIGCYKSTGVLPLFNISYQTFAKNEEHLARYWPTVPMLYLDNLSKKGLEMMKQQDIDFVTSVCPCAGLSTLNSCQAGLAARGPEAVQNDWMLRSAELVLSVIKPKVFWGENAPGLFTKSGRDLVTKLKLIGQRFGYSFSLVKTNSELHGLPQRRVRTFYFFWRSPCAPLLAWMKLKPPGLVEYLSLIPSWASLQDVYVHDGLASHRFRPYQFLLKREGLSHQEFSKKMKRGMTVARYLERNGLIDTCIKWLKKFYPKEKFSMGTRSKKTHIHFLRRMKKKLAQGKGYWDVSVKFMGNCFTAVISKNILHAVHPIEDRFFSIRELLHLMGMPHDFEIDDVKNMNHICQNVPVNTAKDVANEVVKFCKGESEMTKFKFLKQDNVRRRLMETEPLGQAEKVAKVEEKVKLVVTDPPDQNVENVRVENVNKSNVLETDAFLLDAEVDEVKDVIKVVSSSKGMIMEMDPYVQDEEIVIVEDVIMDCSNKRKVLSVTDDVKDKNVTMVCTTKKKKYPVKICFSVSADVSGAAFHDVDENGNYADWNDGSFSVLSDDCRSFKRSAVTKLEENFNSVCDGERKRQRIDKEGIRLLYKALDYRVKTKSNLLCHKILNAGKSFPIYDFHSGYNEVISEKLNEVEEDSKESSTCSTCGLDSARVGLRRLDSSTLTQLEEAFDSSREIFDSSRQVFDFQGEHKRLQHEYQQDEDFSEEIFTCSTCGMYFSRAEFVKHQKDWTCSPEYQCAFCGKKFKGAGRFMKHRSRSMHYVR